MNHAPDERLPAEFGKYRLEKRIAAGGMAEVFLAHRHDAPHEPLVIKRILPNISQDKSFVQMFTDEARMAANLDHPNVVRILDLGLVEGAYFMAMEYVHGEDIRRIYNRAYKLQRSLPLSHSIRVIADAAQGLSYAHRMQDPLTGEALGLVHRDVSPQNILVTYAGDAKVVDFGIAKAAHKVVQTRAGQLKGKYSYMSPEQALGEKIDHRTDIFALGIILYELTTGTRLFKRQNELATLQAVMKCEVVPPHETLPNYPSDLERILLKALAKRADERWQDGADFSQALFDFLHGFGLFVEREEVGAFMRDLFADPAQSDASEGEAAAAESPHDSGATRVEGPAVGAKSGERQPTVSERRVLSDPADDDEDMTARGTALPQDRSLDSEGAVRADMLFGFEETKSEGASPFEEADSGNEGQSFLGTSVGQAPSGASVGEAPSGTSVGVPFGDQRGPVPFGDQRGPVPFGDQRGPVPFRDQRVGRRTPGRGSATKEYDGRARAPADRQRGDTELDLADSVAGRRRTDGGRRSFLSAAGGCAGASGSCLRASRLV